MPWKESSTSFVRAMPTNMGFWSRHATWEPHLAETLGVQDPVAGIEIDVEVLGCAAHVCRPRPAGVGGPNRSPSLSFASR